MQQDWEQASSVAQEGSATSYLQFGASGYQEWAVLCAPVCHSYPRESELKGKDSIWSTAHQVLHPTPVWVSIFAQCSRSKDDKVGVLLYGVKEKQNPNNFDGIRLLHDLDRPSAFWLSFS